MRSYNLSIHSIRAKLQLAVGLVVTLVLAFVLAYVPHAQQKVELTAFEHELVATTDALAITIGVALEGKSFEGMKLASQYVSSDEDDARVVISEADGGVVRAHPRPGCARREPAVRRDPVPQGRGAREARL